MKKKLLIIGILIVLVSGAFYVVINNNKTNIGNIISSSASSQINTNTLNVKAMDFTLKDLTGKELSLSDLKGKNVLLNFWATWCPPCKGEMPDIQKLYKNTQNSDLIIIAVNLGENQNTVNNFINNKKYTFKVLLDEDQRVAQQYNIVSIPTSFFIDKAGNIVWKKIGPMSYEEMKGYLELLKK